MSAPFTTVFGTINIEYDTVRISVIDQRFEPHRVLSSWVRETDMGPLLSLLHDLTKAYDVEEWWLSSPDSQVIASHIRSNLGLKVFRVVL